MQALQQVDSEKTLDLASVAIQIEATRDGGHGDFASNLAMTLAKPLRGAPRKIAEALVAALPASPLLARVEIAGPGFINFFLTADAWQAVVPSVLAAGADYGCDRSGQRGRVMVEYVSANPTGPMHIGHGRGAAYGDSLANLLAVTGWSVHREYYINDAGRQVDILALSVWLRYLQRCGETLDMPRRGYPGDYIRSTADTLHQRFSDSLRLPTDTLLAGLEPEPVAADDADEAAREQAKAGQERYLDALIQRARQHLGEHWHAVKRAALDDQLAAIAHTLGAFNVRFDQWYSEQSLVDSGFARTAIERLQQAGHVYEQDGALWLRTSAAGDEKDRVLFKADGAATYFANDLAYHVDKLDRGFDLLIDVWGADHHGYIARVRAALAMLTGRPESFHVALIQFVTLKSGRMGKRSGNFVTLQDLIDEVGGDATRFFFLQRSQDQQLEFDIDLARSQSNDNPVYYVQYAHARICSVFRQLAERGQTADFATAPRALHRLGEPHEKALLMQLWRYPEMLRLASREFSPHTVAFYLRDLADALHSYYNAHKFIVDDAELQLARLSLIRAVQQVLVNGLAVLGVAAVESM